MTGTLNTRCVILSNTILILLLLVTNHPEQLAGGPSKSRKKIKPFIVNPKLPFYKGRFFPCKGTREMNPVETVKARNWATQVFANCGPKLIVHYASKWNVPAFAIQKIGDRICLISTFMYAFHSIDNGSVISEAMAKDPVLLEPSNLMLKAIIKLNHTKHIIHGNRSHYIHPNCFVGFAQDITACFFLVGAPTDLDYVKHVVNYYRFIVL